MSPPSPTERFSQLSIESMPPTTRSRSRIQDPDESATESDHDSVEPGCNSDDSITFPSGLSYSVDELDEATQEEVAEMMNRDPPRCILQGCKARDDFIVFQVAELVQHSVRAIQPGIPTSLPHCSCDEKRPCRHMLWLYDQITNQLEPTHRKTLTLTAGGYPSELGNIYDKINEFHLDMLAEALHSQMDTDEDNPVNPHRVQSIREMMASLNAAPADGYRPDLFANPTRGKRVIKTGDLEGTIFRMLLRNDSFFQYFRSSLRYDEVLRSPLRKLQWRAETAIAKFDAFSLAPAQPSHDRVKDAEWCAGHLLDVDRQINSITQHTDRPLSDGERHEIIRFLIHMVQEVVHRNTGVHLDYQAKAKRNLYFALLGNRDRDFVTGTLESIPSHDIFPFTADISSIIDTLGRLEYGVPITYMGKLRRVVKNARRTNTSSPSGAKRPSGGQDSRAKRMK
ncbi:uncharacterized protein PG998_001031 [Apiospora kogelbergensis]|uniref:uncharacterized protein n=1 Tax=Apiospora kogelbergensis TaxID=1337665 RepID=UPI00313187FD